jgi:hypothetical protein
VAAHGKPPPKASHLIPIYADETKKGALTIQRDHLNEILIDFGYRPTKDALMISLPIYKLLEEIFMLDTNNEVNLSIFVDEWIKCMDKNNVDHDNALAEIPYGKFLFNSNPKRIPRDPGKLAAYIVKRKAEITRPRLSPRRA